MQTSGRAVYRFTHTKRHMASRLVRTLSLPQTNTQCLIGTNMAFTRFCALSFLFFLPDCVYLPGCEVKSCLVPTVLLCFLQISHILLVRP